ncbi:MAG TPA: hypothetical protein PK322_02995 [Opitutaceae bacterium]|nr:hypothetical protein [Opitutaceae bacterium]
MAETKGVRSETGPTRQSHWPAVLPAVCTRPLETPFDLSGSGESLGGVRYLHGVIHQAITQGSRIAQKLSAGSAGS